LKQECLTGIIREESQLLQRPWLAAGLAFEKRRAWLWNQVIKLNLKLDRSKFCNGRPMAAAD